MYFALQSFLRLWMVCTAVEAKFTVFLMHFHNTFFTEHSFCVIVVFVGRRFQILKPSQNKKKRNFF